MARRLIVVGEGIGSNYWDLLPFGGEDALGTVYYYDALLDLAELEEQIAAHPQWCVATGADAFDPQRPAPPCARGQGLRHPAVLEPADRAVRHRRSGRDPARLRVHVSEQ